MIKTITSFIALTAALVSCAASQPGSQSHLLMRPTGKTNSFGNPIHEILFYTDGTIIGRVEAVSGRGHTQNLNRNTPGNEAPLPNGIYSISKTWILGASSETGNKFLPITPNFSTKRTALGLHLDPSFNKNKQNDGTAGCIGITTVAGRDFLFSLIHKHKPDYLQVSI